MAAELVFFAVKFNISEEISDQCKIGLQPLSPEEDTTVDYLNWGVKDQHIPV